MFYLTIITFCSWLYRVGHMGKDQSYNERGNQLPPNGYSLRLAARVLLYIYIYISSHRQDSTSVMEHWSEREIGEWVHYEGLIRPPIAPLPDALPRRARLVSLFYRPSPTHFIYSYMMSDIF